MSVLTLPADTAGADKFETVHEDLLATLRLHKKHSDGSTQHIAVVLIDALTAQKEDLRAKCQSIPGSRPGAGASTVID